MKGAGHTSAGTSTEILPVSSKGRFKVIGLNCINLCVDMVTPDSSGHCSV